MDNDPHPILDTFANILAFAGGLAIGFAQRNLTTALVYGVAYALALHIAVTILDRSQRDPD